MRGPAGMEPAEISDERPIPRGARSRVPTIIPMAFSLFLNLGAPRGARTKSLILAQDERWRRA